MENVLVQHIEIAPGVCGGRPHIAGRRITVADIAILHLRMGHTLEEIAGDYDLELAALHAAMAYYYDHRAEIDARIEEDDAFAEAFRRDNPSPLAEKLRALRRG